MIKITSQNGLLTISSNDCYYSNFKQLYKVGYGIGLQINPNMKNKRNEILNLCNAISDSIYELESILNTQEDNNNE